MWVVPCNPTPLKIPYSHYSHFRSAFLRLKSCVGCVLCNITPTISLMVVVRVLSLGLGTVWVVSFAISLLPKITCSYYVRFYSVFLKLKSWGVYILQSHAPGITDDYYACLCLNDVWVVSVLYSVTLLVIPHVYNDAPRVLLVVMILRNWAMAFPPTTL